MLPINIKATYSLEGHSFYRISAPTVRCANVLYRHPRRIGVFAASSVIDGKRLRHSSQSRLKPNGFCVDDNAGT